MNKVLVSVIRTKRGGRNFISYNVCGEDVINLIYKINIIFGRVRCFLMVFIRCFLRLVFFWIKLVRVSWR